MSTTREEDIALARACDIPTPTGFWRESLLNQFYAGMKPPSFCGKLAIIETRNEADRMIKALRAATRLWVQFKKEQQLKKKGETE